MLISNPLVPHNAHRRRGENPQKPGREGGTESANNGLAVGRNYYTQFRQGAQTKRNGLRRLQHLPPPEDKTGSAPD